jgi:hypothetical protein
MLDFDSPLMSTTRPKPFTLPQKFQAPSSEPPGRMKRLVVEAIFATMQVEFAATSNLSAAGASALAEKDRPAADSDNVPSTIANVAQTGRIFFISFFSLMSLPDRE